MSHVDFKLYQSSSLVIDASNLPYEENRANIVFEVDGINYQYQLNNKQLKFIRFNDEFVFTIGIKNDIKTMTYKLIAEDIEVEVPYEYLYYEITDNFLNIYYKIDTEPEAYHIVIMKEEKNER